MNRVTQIRAVLNQRGIFNELTQNQLLDAISSLPRRPKLGVPAYADDTHDPMMELLAMTAEQREKLGLKTPPTVRRLRTPLHIPQPNQVLHPEVITELQQQETAMGSASLGSLILARPFKLRTLMPRFEPHLRVRVQALVCRNDDGRLSNGSIGQSQQEIGQAIAKTIAAANAIFDGTGIELIFYPSADLQIRNDTRLNQDFIIPTSEQAKLTKTPPLTQAEIDALCSKYDTSPYRNEIARQFPGKLVLLFAEGTTIGFQTPPTQKDWRYCKKCQGLAFGGGGKGVCSAGGQHDFSSSGDYELTFAHDDTATGVQDNWRYCNKCQGLAFAGTSKGVCSAGGQHEFSSSGDYALTLAHQRQPKWVISSPSGGGFSWEDKEFAKLSAPPEVNSDADAESYATFLCHEVGHYLHLWHTFYQLGLTGEERANSALTAKQKADIMTQRVKGVLDAELDAGKSTDQVVRVLDGDSAVVSDTPPDDSGELLHYLNQAANGGDSCGAIGEVKIQLKNGKTVSYAPDRSLVMSYFKGCINFDQHYSPGQAQRMRDALINKNRRHLVKVQLGETSYPGEYVCATWNPNTNGQFYTWGNSLEDFKNKFDEMKAKGLRLRSQQAYTRNGKTFYDGIWNPGSQSQEVIWGWTVEDFKSKTNELSNKEMRLIHLESYLLPDNQVRINAIWNSGNYQQRWIQGWAGEDLDSKATKMHSQGFRLVHLNAWNLPDGQVRYDALWNPGNYAQFYIRGWAPQDFQKKYGEMWQQNFKLLLLDAHISGGQIRYDAVWNPDSGAQYVVWGKTREQVRADYDEMWQQGMKLTSMNSVRL